MSRGVPMPADLATATVRERILTAIEALALGLTGVSQVLGHNDTGEHDATNTLSGGAAVARVIAGDDEVSEARGKLIGAESMAFEVAVMYELPDRPTGQLDGLSNEQMAARLHSQMVAAVWADPKYGGLAIDTDLLGGGGLALDAFGETGMTIVRVFYRHTRGNPTEAK